MAKTAGDPGEAISFAIVPDPQARAAPSAADPRVFEPNGMGLALSGGGYKAAAYHLGGLSRLNELGLLSKITRISSVSGGSITAGWLALKWGDLRWRDGVATNFRAVIHEPLKTFLTTVDIDAGAILGGILHPFQSGADRLEKAYAKHLFGKATLQDLVDEADAPRFVLLATNYQLNSLWRFSRAYAADYRVGLVRAPRFPLARIVAASSGFPPFFAPIRLDLTGQPLERLEGADRHEAPFTQEALLADGGIYDNMGVEPIWKRFGVLLVSNAGDAFDETASPPRDWLRLLRRVLGMIHRQAENNRVRQFVAMAQAGKRRLIYWPLRNTMDDYPAPGPVRLPDEVVKRAQGVDVRLKSLETAQFAALVDHGYLLANAAAQSFPAPGQGSAPVKLPE